MREVCYLCPNLKQMKYILGFTLLVLLASCGGNERKITGRWKLDRIDYAEHFKNVPEEVRDMLMRKMDEEFERLKGKTFFTFGADASLKLESPNFLGKIVTVGGKYHFNVDQDSLFFDIEIPESYKVLELSKDSMSIRTDEMPKRTLYLSKQK